MGGGGVMAHENTYAIFSAQYPPHMGGIETFTQSISRTLADLGNKVLVVTNDTEGLGAGITYEEGVEVVRLPCFPLISGRFPLAKHSSSYRVLLKDLNERHLDGVLINARFYFHSLLGMRIARRHGLRPVVLDHGSAGLSFSNPILDPIVRLYERSLTAIGKAKYDPAYYGISKKSSEWLKTFGIESRGEITNSIDAAQFRALSSGRDFRDELDLGNVFLVAFVGRLIPEKGVSALIEASKSDELKQRNVVFLLAGDGPLAGAVDAAQGESLRWLGRLDRPDISALLQQADVLCLPTRSEGFSTTLLEASACGCPSIVTDVGGARELIPSGEFGLIIESRDSSALIKSVEQIADNLELRKTQSTNCRLLCENGYSWRESAKLAVESLERASAGLGHYLSE